MSKIDIIPMPAGAILSMVAKMVAQSNLQKPITLEVLLRAKDRYITIASLLN